MVSCTHTSTLTNKDRSHGSNKKLPEFLPHRFFALPLAKMRAFTMLHSPQHLVLSMLCDFTTPLHVRCVTMVLKCFQGFKNTIQNFEMLASGTFFQMN